MSWSAFYGFHKRLRKMSVDRFRDYLHSLFKNYDNHGMKAQKQCHQICTQTEMHWLSLEVLFKWDPWHPFYQLMIKYPPYTSWLTGDQYCFYSKCWKYYNSHSNFAGFQRKTAICWKGVRWDILYVSVVYAYADRKKSRRTFKCILCQHYRILFNWM